jgi:hypothetical protein
MGLSSYPVTEHPKLLLAMPARRPAAGQHLWPHCPYAWEPAGPHPYGDRGARPRPEGAGSAAAPGGHRAAKRLCLLAEVNVSPLHARRAVAWGMGPRPAPAWRQRGRAVWPKAVDHGGAGPARAPQPRATSRAAATAAPAGRDGPERPRPRPREPDKQNPSERGHKRGPRARRSCGAASRRGQGMMCAHPRPAHGLSKRWRRKPPPIPGGQGGGSRDRLSRVCPGWGAAMATATEAPRARASPSPERAQPSPRTGQAGA